MRLFDLHCDTLTVAMNAQKSLAENDLQLDFARGAQYRPWIQTMAVFVPDTLRGDAAWSYFTRSAQYLTDQLRSVLPDVVQCRSGASVQAVRDGGGRGVLLAVEGGAVLGGRLDRVPQLAQHGVRMLTLTWNGADEWGGGAAESGGLTAFGREALMQLRRFGIVPDLSHASDPLFWDVCHADDGPLVATHSNCRARCAHRRNLTDAQLRVLIDRGGLVGLNLYPEFLTGGTDASLDDVYAHLMHICDLGGSSVIALGTDFDGADMPSELPDVAALPRLAEYLLRRNLSESFINGVFFDHAAAFFARLPDIQNVSEKGSVGL